MADKFYEKGEKYIKDDDLENGIKYLLLSLEKNNNYDSAFDLGIIYLECYEDLELDKPDYQNAIKYFSIGAKNNHKDCQKELGLLLIESEDKCDIFEGIKWLLSSEEFESKREVDRIKNSISILYKKTNQQLEKDVKLTIRLFNEIIKLTKNSKILTPIFDRRNELINNYARKIISESKTLQELETGFEYFQRYMDKEFFSGILSLYCTKEINLYIDYADSVLDVEHYLQSLDDRDFNYNTQAKGILYLWLARSYRDGTHHAKKDIEIAMNYYKKVGNTIANLELEKLIVSYCDELIKNEDYETVKKYLPYIQSFDNQYRIKNVIDEFDKKESFNRVKAEAMLGDINAKIKLAKLYEEGVGTPRDLNKAVAIQKDLYEEYHLKTSFDFIYNYYCKNNDYSDLKLLLEDARKNNVEFDYYQESKYASLISYYATSNYDYVHTRGISFVDVESNIIYYLFDYYKKWWVDTYPNNNFYKDNFFTFMAIKKRNYSPYSRPLNFPGALYNFLKLFSNNEVWFICTVPGHEKTTNISNGVSDIIEMVKLRQNFVFRSTIIQRKYTVDKKATSSFGRNNDYRVDMKSLTIEDGFNVIDKNIIVVDDITTSGSTLISCRNILMDARAKRVVLIALGKTKEQMYEF